MTTADVLTMALAGFAVVIAAWVVVARVRVQRAGDGNGDANGDEDGDGVLQDGSGSAVEPGPTPSGGPKRPARADGPREWPPRPPTLPQRPRTAAVSVLLIDRRDGTTVWRIASTTEAQCTTVDVFSFRHETTSGLRAWHHELLDGPLHLGPHESAEFDGPTARGRFVVSVAWTTTLEGGGIHRERRLATVEPSSS